MIGCRMLDRRVSYDMATLHVRDVPETLYDRVRKLAASRNRSLSAEVTLLDQAHRDEGRRLAHVEAMASTKGDVWTPPPGSPDSHCRRRPEWFSTRALIRKATGRFDVRLSDGR